jgi:hypothetical protein
MLSFKEFLQLSESPYLDAQLGRDRTETDSLDRETMRNHPYADSLGDNYYKNGDEESTEFYHLDSSGKIDAISRIDDGVQTLIRKNVGVDSSVPLNIFRHALDHHGRIESDSLQSPGSKKFWQLLPKHFPDAKFQAINDDLDKTIDITHDDLIGKEKSIWGNNKTHIRIAIIK